ncbi:DUF4174 domain-containing protein [Neptunicoccus sediminis]|uniref:DUF4174 domain-containing protein n=1 Tax=Neptunicoccus sediminis TaxID=1892596 RepID=UPI000845D7AA|nr:DUF4174 domain-containing protein [Neptunicoccus sediminis]
MNKTRLVLALCLSIAAAALPASANPLEEYLWVKRPLVIFADTPEDPRFVRQMELLAENPEDLEERDVVVLIDTDAANPSDLRKLLRPRGFQLTIVGKDGQVKLRKPRPWTIRELNRSIDKMPLRQQEIRQRWER